LRRERNIVMGDYFGFNPAPPIGKKTGQPSGEQTLEGIRLGKIWGAAAQAVGCRGRHRRKNLFRSLSGAADWAALTGPNRW
jgi:hypothetical protein